MSGATFMCLKIGGTSPRSLKTVFEIRDESVDFLMGGLKDQRVPTGLLPALVAELGCL